MICRYQLHTIQSGSAQFRAAPRNPQVSAYQLRAVQSGSAQAAGISILAPRSSERLRASRRYQHISSAQAAPEWIGVTKTRSRSASDIADAKQPDKYIQPASTDVSRWFSPHSIHSEAFCAEESRRGGRAAEPLAKVRE